jgi:hypothetical protein
MADIIRQQKGKRPVKQHGNSTHKLFETNEARNRKRLWDRQKAARETLSSEDSFKRLINCRRHIHGSGVTVTYSKKHKSAQFIGLNACNLPWICPLCAAKIAQKRQEELEIAINNCRKEGGVIYLSTYTIAHTKHDKLGDLLRAQEAAMKRTQQGQTAQKIKRDFEVIGSVSVREITWSPNAGFHPHYHVLTFFRKEINAEAYATIMRERWEKATEHEGLRVNEHGFRFDPTYGAVHQYVTKIGRRPTDTVWSSSAEMTKSHIKEGRSDGGISPFRMLDLINEGEEGYSEIFKEYALRTKGKHQFVWSHNLRRELGIERKALLDTERENESEEENIALAFIPHGQWKVVLVNNLHAEILEIARSGNATLLGKYLASRNIEAKILGGDPGSFIPTLLAS